MVAFQAGRDLTWRGMGASYEQNNRENEHYDEMGNELDNTAVDVDQEEAIIQVETEINQLNAYNAYLELPEEVKKILEISMLFLM